MSVAEISQLQRLSTQEKLELIEALWESIGPEIDEASLSDEQARLLDERLKADVEHPEQAISLEDLLTRVAALR